MKADVYNNELSLKLTDHDSNLTIMIFLQMSTKKKKKKIKTLLIPENTLVKSTKNTNNPPVHQIYQISISCNNDAVTTGNLTNPASHATLHNRTLQKTLDRSITGAQQE